MPVVSLSSSRFELDTPAPVGGSAAAYAERRRMGSGAQASPENRPKEHVAKHGPTTSRAEWPPVSGRAVRPQYCSCRVAHVVDGMSSGSTLAIPRIEERIEEQIKWASICVALLLDGLLLARGMPSRHCGRLAFSMIPCA